jgi:N-acetylneuraminic acid mutarotase
MAHAVRNNSRPGLVLLGLNSGYSYLETPLTWMMTNLNQLTIYKPVKSIFMFSILKKTCLSLLFGCIALGYLSCNNDNDPEKSGNWFKRSSGSIPDFSGSVRTNSVSFTINDIGYICTGFTNASTPRTKDLWGYDIKGKYWSQEADFPGSARNNATAFVLNGKAYVGTGYDGMTSTDNGYRRDFYVYDPKVNGQPWRRIADFPGGPRQFAVSFVVNNRAYVGMGHNGSNNFQDFYEFDPAAGQNSEGKWTPVADFGGGKRIGAIAFTIGDKAYVGFGRTNSGVSAKDLYTFDPSSGDGGKGGWKRVDFAKGFDQDAFPARAFGLALVINGKAYIIGGEGRSDVWEYDPGANSWTEKAPFFTQRGFAAGFVSGNTGYFGTGSSSGSGNGSDDFWGYDPAAPVNDDDDR